VALFGFSTGIKTEKFNSHSSNILNSFLVPVQSPQEIEEKNSKNFFCLSICTGTNTLFLDLKIFGKILELHLVSGTTFKKNYF
jgi:hypothetical protein